jgi:hypothetical protein
MVFTKVKPAKTHGFDSSSIAHASKKARRDPPVADVICNFYDINNRDLTANDLRFIGISYDGIAGKT